MSTFRQSLDAKTDDDGVLGFADADDEEDDVDADDLDDASDEAAQEEAESDSDESGISSADSDDDISSGMEVDENVRRSVKAALGSAAVSSDAEVSFHSSLLHLMFCVLATCLHLMFRVLAGERA